MRILAFCDYFAPGYKAGGPVKTLENLNRYVGDDVRLSFVTRDRDLGDTLPFAGLRTDRWVRREGARVMYLRKRVFYFCRIACILRSVDCDLIYLNSLFSPSFSILVLLAAKVLSISSPVLIAPRGECSPGFLSTKRRKKAGFCLLMKLLGLYDDVYWHASSADEMGHIAGVFPKYKNRILIATNISDLEAGSGIIHRTKKERGRLNVCFISRIHRQKNLHVAIEAVNELRGTIALDIYGQVHTASYWNVCAAAIRRSPQNVTIRYFGHIGQREVQAALFEHDILFLPTLGENYGHIILEALATGCPVLMSDQTPWNDVEQWRAGWVVKDNVVSEYVRVLNGIVDCSQEELWSVSQNALRYYARHSDNEAKVGQHRRMFEEVRTRTRG